MDSKRETAALKGMVTKKINAIANRWNGVFHTNIHPKVEYFEKGTDGGYTIGSERIGINLHYLRKYRQKFVNEIVPHEMAHAFQDVLFSKDYHFHSANWRRLCIGFGGSGETYHHFEE